MEIAVIGVGNRARKYLSCLPDWVRLNYLVEPEQLRLEQTARRFGVPADHCFSSSEEFFSAPRPGVDAVIVAAPDRLHVPLALKCVERGWPVLLEKPAATDDAQYRSLLEASRKAGVHVGVCLEMRCHPYFVRVRELARRIGPIVSIDHTEHIGPDRMAHTFVRGLWSRKEDAGPIFLSKCSHDADFVFWLTGADLEGEVVSRGELTRFRSSCAPEGSAARCISCPIESECRYSAVDLYRRRGAWTSGFDVPEGQTLDDVIGQELKEGRYGRCVYRCDNDVFDTQELTAILTGGIKLRMRLEGTSLLEGRSTVIRGRDGSLEADGGRIILRDAGGKVLLEEDHSELADAPLHAGADRELALDFFRAIENGREPVATLESAYRGHRLCYLAEN